MLWARRVGAEELIQLQVRGFRAESCVHMGMFAGALEGRNFPALLGCRVGAWLLFWALLQLGTAVFVLYRCVLVPSQKPELGTGREGCWGAAEAQMHQKIWIFSASND